MVLWGAKDTAPSCGTWSESAGAWQTDGVGVDAVDAGTALDGVITCRTHHLSAFAASEESVSEDWNSVDLLNDYDILGQVLQQDSQSSRDGLTLVASGTAHGNSRACLYRQNYDR